MQSIINRLRPNRLKRAKELGKALSRSIRGGGSSIMEIIRKAEKEGIFELVDNELWIINFLVDSLSRHPNGRPDEKMRVLVYLLDRVRKRDYTLYKYITGPLDMLKYALTTAARWDNLEAAELIMQYDPDPDQRDSFGSTPLFHSGPRVTPLLLENGYRLDAKDNDGLTPIVYSERWIERSLRDEEEDQEEGLGYNRTIEGLEMALIMLKRYYIQNYGPDLEYGMKLHGVDLHGIDLSGVVLRGADLSGTDLSGTDLRGADLNYSVLDDADLRGAEMDKDTNLESSSFYNAKIDFHNMGYISERWLHHVEVFVDPNRFEYTLPNVFLVLTLNLGNMKGFLTRTGTKFTNRVIGVLEEYIRGYVYTGEDEVSYFDRGVVCSDDMLNAVVPSQNLKYFKGTGMVAIDDPNDIYDDTESITYKYYNLCYSGETPNNIKYAKFLLYIMHDVIYEGRIVRHQIR